MQDSAWRWDMATQYEKLEPFKGRHDLPDFDEHILDHVVKIWIASGSPLPPLPEEVFDRPRKWDNACVWYRKYFESQLKK